MNSRRSEKKAIIGIVISLVLFASSIIYVGQKNFWFSSVVNYKTIIRDAQGLRKGAAVSLKGIRAGEITSLSVNKNDEIEVNFLVNSAMAKRIRVGTRALVVRSFLIGEKRIDLSLGAKENPMIPQGGTLESIETKELTEIISGRNLNPMITQIENVGTKLDSLLNSLGPTLKNVDQAAKSITSTVDIAHLVKRDLLDNKLAKKTLQDTRSFLKPFKNKSDTVEELIDSAHKLAMEIGQNPNLTKDVTLTLKEAITTLKAIQKTWLLKSHVEDVKKANQK